MPTRESVETQCRAGESSGTEKTHTLLCQCGGPGRDRLMVRWQFPGLDAGAGMPGTP
jgi:hypothetical protein